MILLSKTALVVSLITVLIIEVRLLPQDEQQAQKQEKRAEKERFTLPLNDPDKVARRDFMRTKLMYTQNIFEGLTVGDFDDIKTAVREVQMVTEGGQWVEIDNEIYRRLTEEFKTSTKRLAQAAETGNIEATALRFYEMSNRCIDCHQHIRKANYEY